jgi:xanthine dehydrogenase accessory factor
MFATPSAALSRAQRRYAHRVFDLALSVAACLRAGTRVDVAWAVQTQGFSSRDPNEALAITPGGGRIGSVLSGAGNEQVAQLAAAGGDGRLVRLAVSEFEAQLAGLACGGDALCLLVPATAMPPALWDHLRDRDPVCLVTRLDDDKIRDISLYDKSTITDAGEHVAELFARGRSDTLVTPEAVVTVLWPVPKLVVVGAGTVADALSANAALLGWQAQVVTEAGPAVGLIAGLAVLDSVVVTSHDHETAGRALAAALDSPVGYIGALGSRRTQQARAEWLAYRGVTDLSRVHGPAGLDIGARTPAEIAVSILAEALAARAGATGAALRDRTGSVH